MDGFGGDFDGVSGSVVGADGFFTSKDPNKSARDNGEVVEVVAMLVPALAAFEVALFGIDPSAEDVFDFH